MSNGGAAKGYGRFRIGWEFFGTELKRCREAVGMSQDDLGRRVFCSGAYIGQIENASRKPQLDLAERIDQVLATGGLLGRMCKELINKSPFASYFAEAAELQARASTICQFSPLLVPGLLQTEEYARAVTRAARPFQSAEDTEDWVRNRLERARLLQGPDAPEYWTILDEGVLRRPVGGRAAMARQLDHLAEVAERDRVLIQVLPFSAGAHALMDGSLMLMTFEDAPPVGYAESVDSGQLLDEPAVVKRCEAAYDLARAAALPPEAALALIRSVAKEYRDGC
ncbi:transcriptional regulator with XRE-family HTH domain [Kitasatospora sp. MAA4]|uniref:helix-turn-helix domain-containing protein n=1 Tax=Kitasatospora sp. MAA4 TaxID=3035093 RepID=UPI0024742270|nr:helix-turn-helix transcriptional regulator [Kitasatospora sp. MAA4]MDH6136374.1 transcriptional regulator with XRE-family HTH domain [Kitasatospora sp. MAA4]